MKRAFTLIELLASIVIISLLALFTISTVSSQFKRKKDELYIQQLKTIKMAAEMYGSENKSKIKKYSSCVTLTLVFLKQYGYIDQNIKNPLNSELLDDNKIFVNITKKENGYTYSVYDDDTQKCPVVDFKEEVNNE